ncbi:MAG: aminotransferase class I/II-fold pyridoxal phosphate-dependent enzyme [Thermodesulfobacteriota bacterium]|nr:aminotransferase class I/II-fold pyridoxal phosphate-dependent enzyme [Thermodesulfobacteriota bacterium]
MKNPKKTISLRHFDRIGPVPVYERSDTFLAFFEDQIQKGLTVKRVVQSPAGSHVTIRDNISGELKPLVMFGSNNYLGLANHPELQQRMAVYTDQYGFGLGGPPLLNGTTELHQLLERRIAELKGGEETLLFTSGFGANTGMITALAGKHDTLIVDNLCHASIISASKQTKSRCYRFRHNDMADLEHALRRAGSDGSVNIFVVVEGVYSMDGDLAPLDKVYELTRRYGAFLIVDDAHGTGVTGKNGRGTAELFGLEGKIDLVVGTFSKALASSGGFVSGKRSVIELLRFYAKTYFFSAAAPPLLVAQVLAGLDIMAAYPALQTALLDNVAYIVNGLNSSGFDVHTDSAIIPVYVPEKADIRAISRQLEEAGVFVNHIEYPAVPASSQRFRISVMATHTKADMDRLINGFVDVYERLGLMENRSR